MREDDVSSLLSMDWLYEAQLHRQGNGGQENGRGKNEPINAEQASQTARASMRRPLPKRFYKEASVEQQETRFCLKLDGRGAKTKTGHAFSAPNAAIGEMLALEWQQVEEVINPALMPITRLLQTAIDAVAPQREDVIADLLIYAGSDLVCYRASHPERLVALESQHWNPVLAHCLARYGARFILSEGVCFVAQPAHSIEALRPRMAELGAEALTALHVLTNISGSVLIALSVLDGAITPEQGFLAGEIEPDFETELWGQDTEAQNRRAGRHHDFMAAARLLSAL